jgi:hypothetical protein
MVQYCCLYFGKTSLNCKCCVERCHVTIKIHLSGQITVSSFATNSLKVGCYGWLFVWRNKLVMDNFFDIQRAGQRISVLQFWHSLCFRSRSLCRLSRFVSGSSSVTGCSKSSGFRKSFSMRFSSSLFFMLLRDKQNTYCNHTPNWITTTVWHKTAE